MRDICAGHPRAESRRAVAWRLRAILILILAAAVAAAFVPRTARAVSYNRFSGEGGGYLTGDPDDGEHKSGPSRLPVELAPSSDLPSPSAEPVSTGRSFEISLPTAGRASLWQALIRAARPLAWLALSARQPWACDPLWVATLPSGTSPATPILQTRAIARTR